MEGEQTFDNSFTIWYHVVAMKMHSSRNSVYLLNYHIVCIPKYRRSILQGEIRESLFTILRRIAKERYWEILALEVMPNHVHLFASVKPTTSPADMVKVFKGISARELLDKYPHLSRKTGCGTLWAPSYFVSTAGNVSSETIRRYIEEQRGR